MSSTNKINKLLLPFSVLYGWVVWFRNKFFDWKILPAEEFSIPIICVGNITVGGTGKTPHVEYLLRLLTDRNKVAVLSRGYKRKTSGFVLADKKATGKTIGDEPFQIFRKFPQAIVAVDGNRRRGIKKLLSLPEDERPQVILLDDAFQHRYVKPSYSILLVDSNRMAYEDTLLPAGRLRESWSGKDRANMIVITKCSPGLKPIDYRLISKHLKLYPYQSLFFTAFKYGELVPCFENEQDRKKKLSEIKEDNYAVLLVAGIANPEGLISELKMYTQELEILTFPDHHAFSKNDIQKIESKFEQLQGENKLIITTEKDFVRLIDCDFSEDVKKAMFYLPVTVVFKNNEETLFTKKIYNHVKKFK
ncbi:MAG: tetraacyldisaccharide 4'-kinase [Dysgonamonadaceae bacterium]|nr:tetraacyldisaccharide 4'-kinase [Dysgonamonadaceae bacterium]